MWFGKLPYHYLLGISVFLACLFFAVHFSSASPFSKHAFAEPALPYLPPPPDSPKLISFLRDTSMPKLAYTTYIGWYEDGGLNESVLMAQARAMATKLRPHGWTHILHDYNWQVCGSSTTRLEVSSEVGVENCIHVDMYGRPVPSHERFPSAYPAGQWKERTTGSWKPIVDEIHGLGLGFGLHLIVGIPKVAVRDKLIIKGTNFTADQVVAQPLCDTFISDNWHMDVNHPGAQAYYDSIASMWAEQGLDFVYLDGVAGDRCGCKLGDATLVSNSLKRFGNGVFLYTSFGPLDDQCTFEKLSNIAAYVRVGADTEDTWVPAVELGFTAYTRYTAAEIRPHHFGDLAALFVGKVHCKLKTPDCTQGPNYYVPSDRSVMNRNEVISYASLIAMFRSSWWPAGVLTEMNAFHEWMLTNDAVIRVTMMSTRNRQVRDADSGSFYGPVVVWTADDKVEAWKYVLMVNMCPCFYTTECTAWCNKAGITFANLANITAAVRFDEIDLSPTANCSVTELWENKELSRAFQELRVSLQPHASLLVRLDCNVPRPSITQPPIQHSQQEQVQSNTGVFTNFSVCVVGIGLAFVAFVNRRKCLAKVKDEAIVGE